MRRRNILFVWQLCGCRPIFMRAYFCWFNTMTNQTPCKQNNKTWSYIINMFLKMYVFLTHKTTHVKLFILFPHLALGLFTFGLVYHKGRTSCYCDGRYCIVFYCLPLVCLLGFVYLLKSSRFPGDWMLLSCHQKALIYESSCVLKENWISALKIKWYIAKHHFIDLGQVLEQMFLHWCVNKWNCR